MDAHTSGRGIFSFRFQYSSVDDEDQQHSLLFSRRFGLHGIYEKKMICAVFQAPREKFFSHIIRIETVRYLTYVQIDYY